MNVRSWWFFGAWLAVGVVGVALVAPELLPVARLWEGERRMFDDVMLALPEQTAPPPTASASTTEPSEQTPIVLQEQSPSDHETTLEKAFRATNQGGMVTEWEGAKEVDAAFGNTIGGEPTDNAGGFGFAGAGPGGGTGNGSINIGSIGTVGHGSGAATTTAKPPARYESTQTFEVNHAPAAMVVAAEATNDADPLPDDLAFDDDEYSVRGMAPEPVAAAAVVKAPTFDNNEFDDAFSEIDRKLASLPLGNIAFNAPEQIPFGETATIELLVSLEEAEEQLREAIRAPGPVESARVRVSPYMEATLSGNGFAIESAAPPRQMLSRSERTKWRWQIEPTKAESLELTLTLSALFTVDGHERTRAIRTFEQTIHVDVPITHRVAQFVGDNQEMLGTLLVVPIVGALYRRFRKRRQAPSGVAQEREMDEPRRAA